MARLITVNLIWFRCVHSPRIPRSVSQNPRAPRITVWESPFIRYYTYTAVLCLCTIDKDHRIVITFVVLISDRILSTGDIAVTAALIVIMTLFRYILLLWNDLFAFSNFTSIQYPPYRFTKWVKKKKKNQTQNTADTYWICRFPLYLYMIYIIRYL
jgi:hypothetical protein